MQTAPAVALIAGYAVLAACSSTGTPAPDAGGGGATDGSVVRDGGGADGTGAAADGGLPEGATAGGDGGGVEAGVCGSGSAATITHPSPIISRSTQGGQAFASPAANAATVNDGVYHNGGWSAGMPTAAAPAWVAIKLLAGPTRLLLSWDDGGTYNYEDPATTTVYGFPANYEIDVSADSMNGSDGTWTTALDASGAPIVVTGNQVRTRAHSFAFTGKSWVKMTITAAPPNISGSGVQIGEIDVHDISAAATGLPEDTWFFMGDSITAFAFDRAQVHQPSFAKAINTEAPPFLPAMINGGIGGELASDGLARLQKDLALNPDYHFFVLGYGTNDSGNSVGTSTFMTNMQSMISMVKAAGRVPVIPHIPYAADGGGHVNIPMYNAVIDQLVQTNQLTPGPDLYTYLLMHSTGDAGTTNDFICPPCANGRTTDDLHPNDLGLAAMNTLWGEAMCPLYP